MRMGVLARIAAPADLRRLTHAQVRALSQEIRDFLVQSVSRTGGHLGPNLGVVELTIAIHRVFESPRDTIVFDTGHQAYVHKLLTGRQDFSALRKRDGLSGYPSRAESVHDVVENSHASTALSWAEDWAARRKNVSQGQLLFEVNCARCHTMGWSVFDPSAVRVETVERDDAIVFRLHVAPDDIGKVIVRQGRLARTLRTIVRAGAARSHSRMLLEIAE